MSVEAKLVVAFLIVVMAACNNQVPSTTTEQMATVTPFALPPTWTLSPRPYPEITLMVSPTATFFPESTFSANSTPTLSFTTSPPPDINDIRLWKLLSLFGQPSNVFINTTSASPTGKVPFSVVIYYDTVGIIALYHDWATINNEKIYFCSKSVISVATDYRDSTTDDNSNFFDVFVGTIDYWIYDDLGLLPLQDSSNLSIEQFYLSFRDQNDDSCIVTSSETWISKTIFAPYPTSTQTPVYPWVETVRPTP